MIEEWKVIREWNSSSSPSSIHLKGDKLYVSNTGKVRLNDIELTLDKGLYINGTNEICIVGTSWPFKTMHRTIYSLFIGEPHHDIYHNIHHIDGNHYNNNVNNLIEVTAKEHADIHKQEDGFGIKKINTWLIEQIKRSDDVKQLTKEWLKQRVKDYYDNEYKQMILNNAAIRNEQQRINKEKQLANRQQYISDKLATGNYTLSADGHLHAIHTKLKGTSKSEEHIKKIKQGVHKAWEDGKLNKEICCKIKGKKRKINTLTNKIYYE